MVEATNCVHTSGDNPAWARPDFDDRQWSPDLPRFGTPYTWSRCRLDLSALVVQAPFHATVQVHGAWELFVDSQRSASWGDIGNGRVAFNVFGESVLPATAERKVVMVALRRYSLLFGPGPSNPALRILVGAEPAIFAADARYQDARLSVALPALFFGGFAVFAGVAMLILYCADWKQRELLWFGVMALSMGLLRLLFIPGQAVDFEWLVALWFITNCINYAALSRFFFSLVSKPVPRFYVAVVIV